jgi:nucleoside-diphosphate-sugar epimerase
VWNAPSGKNKAMRALIIGCGYVGIALGKRLRALGHDVAGIRRSDTGLKELEAAGIKPLVCDITRREELESLSPEYDWVINLVSSSRGGPEEYRRVYMDGTRNILEWLGNLKKFVYTSSTSVYGQVEGELVTEKSPTQPQTETGSILLQAEELLLEAARERNFPAVILRVAGIYGPMRGHLFHQFLRGEARLSQTPNRFLNMIHLDDVVGITVAALEQGRTGEIYNAADNEAVSETDFFQWLSQQLGKPMPPPAIPDEVRTRKRGLTSKRVSNQKIRSELGYQMLYPTFREGYAQEIRP